MLYTRLDTYGITTLILHQIQNHSPDISIVHQILASHTVDHTRLIQFSPVSPLLRWFYVSQKSEVDVKKAKSRRVKRVAASSYSSSKLLQKLKMDYERFEKMSLSNDPTEPNERGREQSLAISPNINSRTYTEWSSTSEDGGVPLPPTEVKKAPEIRNEHLISRPQRHSNSRVPTYQPLSVPPLGGSDVLGAHYAPSYRPYKFLQSVPEFRNVPRWHTDEWCRSTSATVTAVRKPIATLPRPIPNISGAHYGPTFIPYQPVRPVPESRKVPPWRSDTLRSSMTATSVQKDVLPGLESFQTGTPQRGRWTGSPPRSATRYNLRQTTPDGSIALKEEKVTLITPVPDTRLTPSKTKFSTNGVPAPEPSSDYILQASSAPKRLAIPQRLLLVLDLNGTLLFRKRSAGTYNPRPSMDKFIEYCLDNHSVMVWSSARPENVSRICGDIFTPDQRKKVLLEWGRDTLDLTSKQYNEKVQVYKRLDKIWNDGHLQARNPDFKQQGPFCQANTVLIDDSIVKAKKQPYNLIEIPEFLGTESKHEARSDILAQAVAYLEELRGWDDVSSFIKTSKFEAGSGERWDWEARKNMIRDSL